MWLERFLIIVPTLSHKYLSYSWGSYRPRTPEILLLIATFGAMVLFYVLFSKVVPIISIWEMKVGQHPQFAHEHQTTRREGDDVEDAAMTAIYGLFDKPDAAQRAYTGLKRAGIAPRDITVDLGRAVRSVRVQPSRSLDDPVPPRARWRHRRLHLGRGCSCVGTELRVAAGHGRHADRRVVAESGHHLRDDDARRDCHDGRLAARGVEAAAIPASRCTIPRCRTARFSSACRHGRPHEGTSARRSPQAERRR